MLLCFLHMQSKFARRWVLRSTADAIEGSGWGGPLANGVRGGAAGGQPPLPPLTPLRATNSGIPHYDIPGGDEPINTSVPYQPSSCGAHSNAVKLQS